MKGIGQCSDKSKIFGGVMKLTFWDKKKIQVVNIFSQEPVCEITPDEIRPALGYECRFIDVEDSEDKRK